METRTFAFRLAERDNAAPADAAQAPWAIRDGVAVAGCTDPTRQGDYRYSTTLGRDNGVYC